MGRPDATPPPQSSGPSPTEPPPGYPNPHDNPLSPPPDAYMADNDQNVSHPASTRSYVSQSPENIPPPETYPPQKPAPYPPQKPAAYPPESYPPQKPAPYPPQKPAAYPPESYPPQKPAPYPPQKPAAYPPESYPPQKPAPYPPESYPPQQPQPVEFPPQSYSHAYSSPQPQVNDGGYVKTEGIAIGSQYLAPTQGWSNGLFDCADDPENAIITACFPCITFGQIAEIVDNGQTSCATSGLIYCLIASFIGIPCIMSCSYRTKIRNRYGLMETPAPDWATHCFCEWCALCQEFRELKARGLDPAIGWQGNMMRNQQYPTMTPPMNQTMM